MWVSLAQANTTAGLRVGFSSTPDQFLVGGQLNFAPVAQRLYIVPSGEVGIGDHATTLSFNGDLQYRFLVHDAKVHPYAGGGLAVYYVNVNNGGGSDTQLGADILGGMFFNEKSGTPMFVEAKLGLTNEVPDWKFIFGVNF
jgi:hypothetical protein